LKKVPQINIVRRELMLAVRIFLRLFLQAIRSTWINLILLPAFLICTVLSIVRRKKDIGGWLFYFYYWVLAFVVIYAREALQNIKVFAPSYYPKVINHEALVAAVFPRFIGISVVAVIAIIVLVTRERAWLERLRLALLVEVIIAGISVGLDVCYFPRSVKLNVGRWIALLLWLLYCYFSKRVRRVFGANHTEALLNG
jgi:hypothetical protein